MNRRAAEIFTELKSETRPRDLVKKMSGGQRQAVAIARTRLSNAKIVLMDEPTAAISVRQVAEVLNLIRRLRDQGIPVVLISHRMPDVFTVADRVIVMRRGRKVADRSIAHQGRGPRHDRPTRCVAVVDAGAVSPSGGYAGCLVPDYADERHHLDRPPVLRPRTAVFPVGHRLTSRKLCQHSQPY